QELTVSAAKSRAARARTRRRRPCLDTAVISLKGKGRWAAPNSRKTKRATGQTRGRARHWATASLHVRYDERADRAANSALSDAHMAMVVLTRLYLLTLEQVAGWDVEPA